ncbi:MULTISPECIES: hypothetical protein [Streptomyces]|uniref:Uncharacterized protein n=1 Tax=Streptomyces doudnae TaxID=3075536 RepID=A0ABD5EWS2_9ACTN|nr:MULTISPECIES: hypothetical protein [unclassified Streptomyces]MDT0438678.1 hypothetical protein [Streptomyces sp. DSM 41981]MYQ62020.1 hypothetical protein [Streptomyces sp. SID4950]SCD28621.1 hypothetical protein GA0115242_10072 [Streptomyces sp. SolWspMP-5a-2]
MTYGMLTPDVPLGPFEGATITVWAAPGKHAKLHATRSCSLLRSVRATEREVRLGASVVDRMCPRCAAYGRWARAGTTLSIFLEEVTGLGLLYKLDRCHEAGEDSHDDEDTTRAAALLLLDASIGGEDAEEDDWEELEEARQVREGVFADWLDALASLADVDRVLELFPWLRPWAQAAVRRKTDHLEVLSARAARLVAQNLLVLATAVAALPEPELPADELSFAPLGTPTEAKTYLRSLWRRWRSHVEDYWGHPSEQRYLAHDLRSAMNGRRKGADRLMERAAALLTVWEESARSSGPDADGTRVLLMRVPDAAAPQRGSHERPLERLSRWEQAVLASYTSVERRHPAEHLTLTVRVPGTVAVRLLSLDSVLAYEPAA